MIMGPLDMRGLVGAATVIGCPKYGAGFCGMSSLQRSLSVHLREHSIMAAAHNASFLSSLRRSLVNAGGAYPHVALAEIYIAYHGQDAQIRRLHLVVVDLDQPRHLSRRALQQFADLDIGAVRKNCMNTLPIPLTEPSIQGRSRFVYGYSTDGSDFPCLLLWPERSSDGRFCLVDSLTSRYFDLESAAILRQLALNTSLMLLALHVKETCGTRPRLPFVSRLAISYLDELWVCHLC